MPRFAVILAAAVMAVAVTAQAKQFDVTRLDVDLRVTTEAAYELTERYGYAFSGGSYSYLSRTIPKEHIDALHDVAVTSPDVTIEDVTLAEENGAWRIRWTFPSRAEPTRFTVRYTVEGALFATDERNVLDWNVVGTQWPVPVRDIAARVHLPAAVADDAGAIASEPQVPPERTGGTWRLRFRRDMVKPDARFRVKVRFPKAFAGDPPPDSEAGTKIALGVALAPVGLILGAGLSAALIALGRRRRRKPDGAGEPPELTPEQAAVLLGGDEWRRAYGAAIFRLARAGHVVLRRRSSGALGKPTVEAEVHAAPDAEPSPFGAAVLSALRARGPRLRDAGKKLRQDTRPREATRRDLVELGLLAEPPASVKRRHRVVAIGAALAGGAVIVAAVVDGLGWLTIPAAVLFLSAAAVFLALGAGGYETTALGSAARERVRQQLREQRDALMDRAKADPDGAARGFFDALPWLAIDRRVNDSWMRRFGKHLKGASGAAAVLPAWLMLDGAAPADPATAAHTVFREVIPGATAHTGGGPGAGGGAGPGGGGAGGGGGGAGGGGGGGG